MQTIRYVVLGPVGSYVTSLQSSVAYLEHIYERRTVIILYRVLTTVYGQLGL